MGLNRRSVLIGLGALVAGGGALAGTGAFTTVSAERSVSVQTAGDDSAFLQIEPADGDGGSYVTDGDADGAMNIDLADSFNQNGITVVEDVLKVTNNSADDTSTTLKLSTSAPGADFTSDDGKVKIGFSAEDAGTETIVTFAVNNDFENGNSVTLDGTGSSTTIGIEVDTTVSDHTTADATDGNITIVAE
jgi:hypothetical protein